MHRNPQALHLIDLGIQFMIKVAWCIRLKEQAHVRLENIGTDGDCLLAGSVNNTGKRSDVWKSELGSGTVASQLADEIVECSKGRLVHQVVKTVEVGDELQEKHTDHCRQGQNVLVLELLACSDGGLAVVEQVTVRDIREKMHVDVIQWQSG